MVFRNVSDVVSWRLCVGCGACGYACPESNVSLVDVEDDGIRAVASGDKCGSCAPTVPPEAGPGNYWLIPRTVGRKNG